MCHLSSHLHVLGNDILLSPSLSLTFLIFKMKINSLYLLGVLEIDWDYGYGMSRHSVHFLSIFFTAFKGLILKLWLLATYSGLGKVDRGASWVHVRDLGAFGTTLIAELWVGKGQSSWRAICGSRGWDMWSVSSGVRRGEESFLPLSSSSSWGPYACPPFVLVYLRHCSF